MSSHYYYVASSGFEAARRVDILPEGHSSRRLHGHSFGVRVRAKLDPNWALFRGGEVMALKSALDTCVAPLDYNDLNLMLPVPTDENIARWVRDRLIDPKLHSVGVQSTRYQGVDMDSDDHAHIWCRFRFEAAHKLPNVPTGHQCGRMHGHGFEVILHAVQPIGDQDMGIDFDYLREIWHPIQSELNYACLNDIPGLENPTSEVLSSWLWARIKPVLPVLSWITVYETDKTGCHYDGKCYRIWKEQKFESALQLIRAPQDNPRARLHGHSYMIRLHLTAQLDEVMGWTVDYGDVKEIFKSVYTDLDHNLLNKLPDLIDCDTASLAEWIRNQLKHKLPQLDRIDLYETPGCGIQLCWDEQGMALPF